jgi:hypothetical protein
MSLRDRHEAQLTATQADRIRFLEAVLHEALVTATPATAAVIATMASGDGASMSSAGAPCTSQQRNSRFGQNAA